MLTHEDNHLLTRVEGEAPMGQMMRRHWVPACLSEEVAEPDGAPVRVRLFGEDLVAFRDTRGRLGLIGEACPHRLASLELGRNEDCGLRCLYHGWKFDVEGNVLDMPSEPEGSRFKERIKHLAYPTREAAGFVWTYMGPAEDMPEFLPPPWAADPEADVAIAKMHERANWAQALEGAIDSAHSSSLHSSEIKPGEGKRTSGSDQRRRPSMKLVRPSEDKAPKIQAQFTNYGFRYAAIRKPIENAEENQYVRITVYIAPFTALIPPNAIYNVAQVFVPMDDENTMYYFLAWSSENHINQDWWRKRLHAVVGIDLDERYRKVRTRENRFMQDRLRMKLGDFTGIDGIPNQDMAMQETMGAIVDRTRERLGASDVAIVRFRQLMLDAVRTFQSTGEVLGISGSRIPFTEISAYEGIVPKSVKWRDLGVTEEEKSAYRDMSVVVSKSA